MHTTGATSQRFESSLKCFAQYLVDLHRLHTFDSVSKAEEKAHVRLEVGLEEMDAKEMQILMLMQQMTEIYARDRQMQIARRNPYEIIIEQDQAQQVNG